MRAGLVVGLGMAVLGAACCRRGADLPARGSPGPTPTGAAVVWVVDDGARIASKAGVLPAMSGQGDAIWSPGQPVRLFGLPGETIALQVVVTAGDAALSQVEVTLKAFDAAGQGDSKTEAVRVDRFVVHELQMAQRSGGKDPKESLGWASGSMPPDPSIAGLIPDPLIPVERAQPWADYPMTVPAATHRVVWVDLSLGGGLAAGAYASVVTVTTAGQALASIPIELQVGGHALPYAAVRTMVYVDPGEITGRTGSAAAVERAFQMLHAHHLSAVFPIVSRDDVTTYRDELTGKAFTAERGYEGEGAGLAADVVAIGTYGGLEDPTPQNVAKLRDIVAALGELGIRDDPGKTDVFVYAADESCDSAAGAGWSQAIRAAGDLPVRVGWTCSERPSGQPVDIPMVFASAYDQAAAQEATAAGKRVWIYNGQLPSTGAFLTDSWTLSLRANAWIQATHGIDRWFYWESTFWNDDNKGGKGPYDPLVTAETFHNQHGDHCDGDGVLVYPGMQVGGAYRSAGWAGVFPSIRLKQWRRGIQDAGYLELARSVDRTKADAIAKDLVGTALSKAQPGAPGWPTEAKPWVDARRKLFELIASR